jgi:hypothetical protein
LFSPAFPARRTLCPTPPLLRRHRTTLRLRTLLQSMARLRPPARSCHRFRRL